MSYRCVICDVRLDSPEKLEIHLENEHKWGVKKSKNELDYRTWFAIFLDAMLKATLRLDVLEIKNRVSVKIFILIL